MKTNKPQQRRQGCTVKFSDNLIWERKGRSCRVEEAKQKYKKDRFCRILSR